MDSKFIFVMSPSDRGVVFLVEMLRLMYRPVLFL